ncbi:acyltransferase [Frigoribacterium sp. VKM Ac-2530]|uniref:acyltransferase family protein n=1 Tax=Frigoribacterium sp. VKM Ac-2530 TaxID=2783822 RepID=UPI00188C397A|nr:acyltransferase [Frigoribacterium sp. VKM Ac-2530]MBF4579667.1 acyltransferase [Frigoribacterium sp. VKM Ac-2530]
MSTSTERHPQGQGRTSGAAPSGTDPAGASPAPPADALAGRDLVVDLARVVCVLLVVVIHVLMVGVGRDPDGAVVASQPLQQQPWFAFSTWVGQIMPLFFVVGGFASATAWASTQRRGGDGADFVRGRLLRLARPAAALFVVLAVALAVATLLGVDPALLDTAVTGIGTPLWFLTAYGITQVAVPVMARLHATRPAATFVGLATAALLVDSVRYTTLVTDVGLLNLVFVWLFVQQLGFAYASGWFGRAPRLLLAGIALACAASLPALTTVGPWSDDMLTNLNPPAVPLMVLGLGQICLLTLLHPALARLMRTRAARAVVFAVGSRGMTIYLWHLPLLIAVTGLVLAAGGPLPEPASATWWWTRIPVVLLVLGLACALSLVVGRLEGAPRPVPPGRRRPSTLVVALSAVLVIAPPFAVMLDGLDLRNAIAGAVALPAALWLLGRTRPRTDAR